jgi:hypothetical protein
VQLIATRLIATLWALGSVLYECLSRRRPFEGETLSAVVLMACTEPPPPLDGKIPRGLQSAMLRCLEKDRKARFPSIAALAAALAPFAGDPRAAAIVVDRTRLMKPRQGGDLEVEAPGAPPTDRTIDARPPRIGARRRTGRYVIGGAAVAVALLVVAGSFRGGSHPEPPGGVRGGSSLGSTESSSQGPRAFVRPVEPAPPPPPRTIAEPRAGSAGAPTLTVADELAAMKKLTPDEAKGQKLAQCVDLKAKQNWGALASCANDLQALGLIDKARALRRTAYEESSNGVLAAKIRSAVGKGELKTAQAQLKILPPDSVYSKWASDLFESADMRNAEEARTKANEYLASHDCALLKRYIAQLTGAGTGTERVIAVVNAALRKCTANP